MTRRRAVLAGTLAPPILLFLLLLASSLMAADAAAGDDRDALLKFKSAVSADPAGLLRHWSGHDHCSWPGVTCVSRSRQVFSLNITGSDPYGRLAGTLTPSIGSLTELRLLSLPLNSFSGEIPGKICQLKNLQILDLSYNQFNGSIPSCVTSLPNLKAIRVSFNRLSGSIPDEIGTSYTSLEYLDFSGNFLVGSIPRSLGNCSELKSLLLYSNLLDDVLPPELGQLKNLQVLDVSRNSLSGPVPLELGECRELSVLILSNPYFGKSGSNLSTYIDIDDFNYYQGGIPNSVTTLPKLSVFWAPRATLEGELPADWGECGNLEMVNFGENLFTGEIPGGLVKCRNLKFLNLSSNKLTGSVSPYLPVPCMDFFDISANQLSGSIPTFKHRVCPLPKFDTNELASSYVSFFTYKTLSSLAFGSDLVSYHNFGQNNCTGNLPILPLASEKFVKQRVYAFIADRNSLSGQIGSSLFHACNSLKGLVLNLSSNLVSGSIPSQIGELCASLTILDLSGNQISGYIPQNISQLGNLLSLDLTSNQLRGAIPESIGYLHNLQSLLLGHNFLNGSIPNELSQLLSLKVLDLSSNYLTGQIPGSLVNLKNLTTLFLDSNKLSGRVPGGFADVGSLTKFNVSFNNLSGPLPLNTSTISCNTVIGNPLLQSSCWLFSLADKGRNLISQDYNKSDTTNMPAEQTSNSNRFSSIEIASITSATAIVSVLLALIVLFIYTRKCAPRFTDRSSIGRMRRRGRKNEVTIFTDIGVQVTFESVVRATGSFNASNCIGSGGFGATYKAEIAPGVLVAIKRLSVGRFQGMQQFDAEIKTLGRLKHQNLVTLIGYHLSDSEMFLIYNYLPGGNLERFIQERGKRNADWRMLHKIALDIARALAYLHNGCVPRILHRDVKPSNILLDNEYNAYLSDFGLARLLGNSETHATTGVAGTFGYVAPEYAMTCRVSDKADVYSYGVVLMELVSDKKALDPSFSPYGNGFNIVQWASMLLRKGRAREFFLEGLWDCGPHDDMVETLHLAVTCTVDSLSIRPTMKQVVQRLKQLQPPTC